VGCFHCCFRGIVVVVRYGDVVVVIWLMQWWRLCVGCLGLVWMGGRGKKFTKLICH